MADTRTPQTLRERVLQRKAALYQERSSWEAHWREINIYQMPRAGRFLTTDKNRGEKKHNHINDNTAGKSLLTLEAGMMSHVTSPARPWFRTTIKDKQLAEAGAVKAWLHEVNELLRRIFAVSNTYNTLQGMYSELGAFGTAADFVLPDFENVIHHYPMTIGEYALAMNHKGVVDTIVREYEMTVAQIVGNFGLENVSQSVKNMWDTNKFEQMVPVIHLVQPRTNRNSRALDNKNMAFESIYIESGAEKETQALRESGFKRFPALTPRWDGKDTYGSSPGMTCLGDVKQLQHQQLRKSQAIDYQVNPPLQIPVGYKGYADARLPGGTFFVDATGAGQGVRSAFEVNLDLGALREDIMDVRERIRSAYYADLFLMLANDQRSNVTATEVAERHEEKLLALGPVLERLHNELLSPLIDITFDAAAEAGILPPAPPELQDMELDIEFVSTLAQAQKMVASQAIDSVVQRVMTMAQTWPEVLHKIDPLQIVDDLSDMYGINPKVVVPDDIVQKKMEEDAQAMAAQQAAAAAPIAADAAKALGDTDAANVEDVMSRLQGYSSTAG